VSRGVWPAVLWSLRLLRGTAEWPYGCFPLIAAISYEPVVRVKGPGPWGPAALARRRKASLPRWPASLAEQQDPPVAGAGIESESRRGWDFVAVRILMTVDAVDVAHALTVAWGAFQVLLATTWPGWDLASARADVQPEP
jgi:hypothetical protein